MNERDVIPSKDSEFNSFQSNLYNKTNTNAVLWEIDPAKIAELLPFKTSWETAWLIASIKPTRTPVQTTDKDLAREAYEAILRPFIKSLYISPAMNAGDLEECGLKPHATTRTPVPVPATAPLIATNPLANHRMHVYFKPSVAEPGTAGRGKPKGVKYCEFAIKTGGAAPVTPQECPDRLLVSRSPALAEFNAEQAGQKTYCFSRWINNRGEAGPWTDVVEFIVP